jgi:hypothetical protein
MPAFDFEVISTDSGPGVKDVRVRIAVSPSQPASKVLGYIRSIQLKHDLLDQWVSTNAPQHGLEIRGGPTPIFETPDDRATPLLAYEQRFRLTRSI